MGYLRTRELFSLPKMKLEERTAEGAYRPISVDIRLRGLCGCLISDCASHVRLSFPRYNLFSTEATAHICE